MSKDFQVRVTNPERVAEWREVLGTDIVPVRSPIPSRANLPGHPRAMIFELDLPLLTDDQRQRLIRHLANKFGLDESDVAAELDAQGVPILAEDCVVRHSRSYIAGANRL